MALDLTAFLAAPKLLGRDDKLATLSFRINEHDPHLRIIDQSVCLQCTAKPCTVTCPVQNYRVEDNGHTTVYWDSCIECGTCRVICPYHNIAWKFPAGGFGVSYRYG